jgi:hypothetical protein
VAVDVFVVYAFDVKLSLLSYDVPEYESPFSSIPIKNSLKFNNKQIYELTINSIQYYFVSIDSVETVVNAKGRQFIDP